ncbi:MAG: OmpA family protein [Bacteroidales bacterium]|nr:OmpA family protein [Bacteroidales bacterium]
MKGIKTLIGAVAVAMLLAVSFGASAQENANRDENGNPVYGPYLTNRFIDNWFVGVGGGINTFYDNKQIGKLGGAFELYLGKWFTPSIGARLGYRGFTDKAKDTNNFVTKDGKFGYNSVHFDLLWNISNTLSGYKETRRWDLVPYATFEGIWFRYRPEGEEKKITNLSYGAGIGLLNDIRLSKKLDFYIDLRGIVAPEHELRTATTGQFVFIPSVTAGLILNFGKSNFDRQSSVTPTVIPVPFTEDQYNALKDKADALAKENEELKNKPAEVVHDTVYVQNTVVNTVVKTVTDTVTVVKEVPVEIQQTMRELSGGLFPSGSSVLNKSTAVGLDKVADWIKDNPNAKVEIAGYTDSVGSDANNLKLSQARAKAVYTYLVGKGCSAKNLTYKGYGEADPVADNATAEGRAANRRVELHIL